MFTDRRDYLMEMIERVVQALIEQVRKGLGDTERIDELERDVEQAMDDEFAELDARVRSLSSRSAADAIRPVNRLRSYSMLMAGRTLLQARRTQLDPNAEVEAQSLAADAKRALELLLETTLLDRITIADQSLCSELFRLITPESLDPRYLEALIAVGDADPDPR